MSRRRGAVITEAPVVQAARELADQDRRLGRDSCGICGSDSTLHREGCRRLHFRLLNVKQTPHPPVKR